MSSAADDAALETVHTEKTRMYLSIMVVVAAMVVIGTLGNMLSLVYHGFRLPRTATNFNITALAAVDLVMCLVTSSVIIQLYFNITFTNSAGCKTIYFMTYWLTLLSGLVLAFVGLDRYWRICFPFKRQFNVRRSRLVFIVLVLTALLLTSKNGITTDVIEMNVTSVLKEETLTTRGFYCTHSQRLTHTVVIQVFHFIDLLVYSMLIVSGIVCYSCIARRLYKSRKCINDKIRGTRVIFEQPNRITMDNRVSVDQERDTSLSASKWSITSAVEWTKARKQCMIKAVSGSRCGTLSRRETKVTLMMVCLTLVSIVSVAPYFLVTLILKPAFSRPEEELNPWIQLALFSYPLNNVLNPYIIAIFHPKFRTFIKYTFCGKCIS